MSTSHVFASREYSVDGITGAVKVEIEQPIESDDGGDWRCDFRVQGLPRTHAHRAYGVDSLQALSLALSRIAMILHASEEARSERLRWLDRGRGDLGLPLPEGFEQWY